VRGNNTESNLGDEDAAEASNRKATALFEAVAKANPSNIIDQLNVAMGHRILAFSSALEPIGREHLDQAMAITDRLIKIDATNPKVRSERSLEYQNLAIIQNAKGDRGQALESFRTYKTMRSDLQKTNPDYHLVSRGVAMSTMQYADQLSLLGSREESLEQIQAAIHIVEGLIKSDPNPDVKRELAISQNKRALVQIMQGDVVAAEASLQQASASIEGLAKKDPENTLFRADLVDLSYEEDRVLILKHKFGEGVTKLRDIISKIENHQAFPDRNLGDFYIWLGEGQAGLRDLHASLQSYQKAAALLETPAEKNVADDARCASATSYTKIGNTLLKLGDLKGASQAYQKAIDITTPLTSIELQDIPALYPAAEAHAGLSGVLAAEAGVPASQDSARICGDARSAYEKSLAIWRRIPNPSRISPMGFVTLAPHEVAPHRDTCDQVVAAK